MEQQSQTKAITNASSIVKAGTIKLGLQGKHPPKKDELLKIASESAEFYKKVHLMVLPKKSTTPSINFSLQWDK